MNRVLKFNDYKTSVSLLEDFVNRLVDEKLHESKDESTILKIANDLQEKVKFNIQLITTFGTGIAAMYPIVLQLLKNANLNIVISMENVILLTITTIAFIYLEEKKNNSGTAFIDCSHCSSTGLIKTTAGESECQSCAGTGKQSSLVTEKDIGSLKEELRLRGLGNGTSVAQVGRQTQAKDIPTILVKLINCFKSIRKFLNVIFKHAGYAIGNLVDLFIYTTLLIPTMNGILAVINLNELNIETLPIEIAKNIMVFGLGVGTILAKRGFEWISKKITDFLKSKKLFGYESDNKLIDIKTKLKDNTEIINEQ
jgi:hypothetical protein